MIRTAPAKFPLILIGNCYCSVNVLRISPSSCRSSDTALRLDAVMLRTPSASSFNRTHELMTPARLAVPDLPLRPSPHQDALFASLHFGPRGCLSPVGVADRLTAHPLPTSSALSVIQALNRRRESVRQSKDVWLYNGKMQCQGSNDNISSLNNYKWSQCTQ